MRGSVAVAIVNWNTRDHLRACLASAVVEAEEIVVVDNGSTDGSVELVRHLYPHVAIEILPSNPGYGAGANVAVRRARMPYVFLLNSDTILRPGWLTAVSTYLDACPRVAILGPRLVNPDGSLQTSCFRFPRPLMPLLRAQPLAPVVRRIPVLRDHYLPAWPHDRPRRVPWVLGAALALRRTAFDAVGGFDEGYHLYFEEVDLCYRMQQAGWEIHFAPVTEVIHAGGASTSQRGAAMLREVVLSSSRFYERHYAGARLVAARLLLRTGMLGRWVRDELRAGLAESAGRRRELKTQAGVWRRALTAPDWKPAPGFREPRS